MSNPLISIIVPSYNRADYIPETIGTVLQQTYSNWELIIVDDGSSDDTSEIVGSFMEQDERIRYYERQRNPKGGSVCRNIGVEHARGDYFLFLDSDDLLTPSALKQRVDLARQNPEVDFLVFPTGYFQHTLGDSNKVWNQINKTKYNDLERFFNGDTPWHTTGPLWKRTGFEKTGGFIESAQSGQDFEIHTRALILGLSYTKSPDGPRFIDNYVRRGNDDRVTSSSYATTERLQNRLENYKIILDLYRQPQAGPKLSDTTFIKFLYRIALEAKEASAESVAGSSLELIRVYSFGSTFLVQLLKSKMNGSPLQGLIDRILFRVYGLSNLEYPIDRTKGMNVNQIQIQPV